MTTTLAGENISRRVVADYPADHNPYLPHLPQRVGCYPVCAEGHRRLASAEWATLAATCDCVWCAFNQRLHGHRFEALCGVMVERRRQARAARHVTDQNR